MKLLEGWVWQGGSNLPTVGDFVVKHKKQKTSLFQKKKKKLPLRRLLQWSENFHISFDVDHNMIAMWGMKALSVSKAALFFVFFIWKCEAAGWGRGTWERLLCLDRVSVLDLALFSFPEGPVDEVNVFIQKRAFRTVGAPPHIYFPLALNNVGPTSHYCIVQKANQLSYILVLHSAWCSKCDEKSCWLATVSQRFLRTQTKLNLGFLPFHIR